MLLASLANEEKRVTEDLQARLCRDPEEAMGSRAPPASPDPLGSQATQMALWSVSQDHQATRGLPGPQDSRD